MSWLLLCCAPASAQTQGIKRRNERRDDRVPGTLTCSNSEISSSQQDAFSVDAPLIHFGDLRTHSS